MGIYDRDYYRRTGPRYLDALGLSGSACKWLIIINVVAFVLQILSRAPKHPLGTVTEWFELRPDLVLHGEVWRLLTYAFLHDPGMWQHIVFNMLFLWWFGSDVEAVYGTKEFLAFYLVSALLGGVGYEFWAMANGDITPCLGASGAVTAVMVLCACHFPRKVILLFFIIPVPIWLFVVFQVAQDAFVFLGRRETTTAVTVHLAGAAFGFAYFKMQWRLTSLLPSIRAWRAQRSRPRLRVVRPDDDSGEAVPVGAPPSSPMDEQLEAKVDAVLEKVARTGQASLTDHERQILMRASELYKRRRT
ncbi:MAG TPA: rhomboid family intramembrane serine protease [Gemmataceae bacterium]|nr:rhomboid family intramembrane serine protease [Gemmataceae bacterium]